MQEDRVDESYFFPSTPRNYSKFMIESTRDKVSVRADKESELLLINFMSSTYKSITHISYMQIIELLERICAIVNVLIIFISSIGNYFNHYQFQSDLMNSFYDLENLSNHYIDNKNESRNEKRKALAIKFNDSLNLIKEQRLNSCELVHTNNLIKPKNNSTLQMPRINQGHCIRKKTQNNSSLINQSKLTYNNIDTIIPIKSDSNCNNKPKHKHHLIVRKFGHREIIQMSLISFITCCFNKDAKEHNREFCLINKSMLFYQDLKNVYRKIMEINLLKYLLLSKEQLTLYQVIPKPLFKKHNDKKDMNEFAALIHNPNFHFMKSSQYIENSLASPEIKSLFVSKNVVPNGDNQIYEKIVQLIAKGTQ